jgi:TPR repeat protein
MMKQLYKHLMACCLLLLMAGVVQGQSVFPDTLEAAKQGDAAAQYNLGVLYYNGEGVPQDYETAVYWFRKATEQGNAFAQYNLGLSYYMGHGVPQDYMAAIQLFQKAAEQGHARAQYDLGTMYYSGKGVPQNNIEAYAWLNIAADRGSEKASKNRDIVAKKLSPSALSEAQALSNKYYELYVALPFQ